MTTENTTEHTTGSITTENTTGSITLEYTTGNTTGNASCVLETIKNNKRAKKRLSQERSTEARKTQNDQWKLCTKIYNIPNFSHIPVHFRHHSLHDKTSHRTDFLSQPQKKRSPK